MGQLENKLPDPSRNAWNGLASTKDFVPAEIAVVEGARILGGQPSSPGKKKLTH